LGNKVIQNEKNENIHQLKTDCRNFIMTNFFYEIVSILFISTVNTQLIQ